jgi:flavodoxin
MKKTVYFLIAIMMIVSMKAFAEKKSNPQKILVVYYSWSGNTEIVAKEIQKQTKGDIFKIEPTNPYPTDYKACTEQAKKEIKKDYKPAINGKVENINTYDIIFIGTPNWWSTFAPPVKTFLTSYDFSGKTIIPFVTHGSGGEANCISDMKKTAPKTKFKKGLALSGNKANKCQPEVEKWIKESGIEK